jgi:mannosyltransferase
VLYLPWVPTLLYQSSRTGTPWGNRIGPVEVLTITLADLSGDSLTSYLAALAVLVALLAFLVARSRNAPPADGESVPSDEQYLVMGATVQRRIPVEAGLFVATLAIGWAASTATANTYATRYAAVVYPLLVLCIAAGVAVVRNARATVAVLSVFLLLSVYVGVSNARFDRTQAGELADFIGTDLARAGVDGPDAAGAAAVVSCPDQIGVALQRALDARRIGLEVIAFPLAGDPRFIDWVDYAERNEAADVGEFYERVDDRIPADGTVYVAAMPGYRTYEGLCEGVIGHLSALRPLREVVEPDDTGNTGETMGLWVFGPPE